MDGQDINQLWASGSYDQVSALLNYITKLLKDASHVSISVFENRESGSRLELSFLSEKGFPKTLFQHITHEINNNDGLYIRILHDRLNAPQKIQYIFQNGKWNFQESPASICLHDKLGTVFTTGAYIVPFSYTNREGKLRFAWMVTGFEADTYRDGNHLDVNSYGSFLEELTPPADEEDRKTEYIIQSLQANGLQRIELGVYKLRLREEDAALYIRQLESITQAGVINQIESTLDEYLLDSPHFSQTTREILIDAFGRDRTDIFLTLDNALIIGSCRANIWSVTEHRDKSK